MSRPNTPALIDNPQTYTDTWGGRMLRELDETAERSMRRSLSSEVITDHQRATAWEKFYQASWAQKMFWSNKVSQYVRQVLNGQRQPRPEVGAATLRQVLEITAPAVEQEVEQRVEASAASAESREGVAVPMWVSRETLADLPGGLQWSGTQLPAVADSVQVVRRGRPRQVRVVGYFHAEGFLGIEVEFEGRVPAVLRTSPRSQCFFGSEVRGLLAA